MCRRGVFNFISKVLTIAIAAGAVLLSPFSSFAQADLPCADQDPYSSVPCPLDTWVWVLVFAALVFGALKLYHRQKTQASI